MSANPQAGLIDRTLFNLRTAWSQFRVFGTDEPKLRPELPEPDVELLRRLMRDCLEGKGGDVSARARAATLGEAYLDLNDSGRTRFLRLLAEDFGVNSQRVVELAQQLVDLPDDESPTPIESSLRDALRADRVELLTQFNSLPSGVKFLVDMRADLRRLSGRDPVLRELDDNLKRLLRSWFDVGFLDLVRLSWSTPASVLEKLIDYEAVHAIRSWSDLKNRLESDRRCFAFFHPRMPDEPIIFVEVALVKSISGNIQELLDESAPLMNPQEADTAIFYSISNAQVGLGGVGFGHFLIKRVVDDLKQVFPNIKTYSTLSPIPGLSAWMETLDEDEKTTPRELEALREVEGFTSFNDSLKDRYWYQNAALAEAMKAPLMRLAARYLVNEKRRSRALDPVANFHLNNGARLERINWMGDISAKGISESAGMMVNYLYKLSDIESNHEAYRETAKTATTAAVRSLL